MRTLLAVSLLLAGVAAPLAAPRADAPAPEAAKSLATLKAAVRVEGAHVTLGDLFDNAGPRAGDEVAAAPAPGTSLMLDANWLAATAQSHGIVWRPPNMFTAVRVERDAIEIGTAEIEKALANAIHIEEPGRHVALDAQVRLYAPTDGPAEIEIGHVEFDQETNRIKAEIKVAGNDPALRSLTVYGRVQSMVELPVLTRSIAQGEIIRADDIASTWRREELVPAGGVSDARDLIGKTPRRVLRANQPLRPQDVEVPVIVKRNDLVVIVLERPGLYLTAQGKALEDGGKGSVIRVMNVQSNRSIDAMVDASGQVSVRLPGPQQAAY